MMAAALRYSRLNIFIYLRFYYVFQLSNKHRLACISGTPGGGGSPTKSENILNVYYYYYT